MVAVTVGPDGRVLSAAKTANEELIIADLDLSLVTKAKTFADASGHCKYSEIDVNGMTLTTRQRQPSGYALVGM